MSDGDGVYRRDVLKASSAAAVALGLGGGGYISSLAETDDEPFSQKDPGIDSFVGQDEVFKSACSPNCRGKCPLEVHVRDGRVRKIEPQVPEDERYKRACLLGLSHTQRIYNPTRLKYPMKRVDWSPDSPNPQGRGEDAEFERVTWDEALDLVAEGMTRVKDTYSPESVLFHAGSGNYGINSTVESRLANLFGGSTPGWSIDANVGRGFNRITGHGYYLPQTNESEDWENAKTFIAWGTDIFSSQLQMDASKLLDMKEQGGKLVVVDPVYTTTASKADLWLPVNPGKDVHLILGMMNYVLDMGLEDTEFLRKRTTAPALIGPDGTMLDAKGVIEGVTESKPVGVDEQTGELVALEPETPGSYVLTGTYTVDGKSYETALSRLKGHVADYPVEEMAEISGVPAKNIRKAARWLATRGPGGIAPSYAIGRYIHGHVFGQAYAIMLALTGDYGKHGNVHAHHPLGASLDTGGWGSPDDAPGSKTLYFHEYADAMLNGDPRQIKAVYSIESNMLGNQFPNRQRHLKGIENLDMFVVADIHHTPTVQQADIILPAAHWFETEDIVSSWGSHPHITYRHKVQEPLWESRDDYYMIRDLAKKLGFGDYFPEEKREVLRTMSDGDDRFDFDELRERGTAHLGTPTVKYTGEFPTPSGRIELYDEDAPSEKGVDLQLPKPIESRTAEDYEGADEYPLIFMQKHGRFRLHSQFEYQQWIREINPEPQLDIHPKDAEARGIEDDDYVRVHNDRGEMVVKAKLNDAMKPGLVNTDQGWWTRDYVKGHHNDLTHDEVSDVGKTFSFYDVRVEVEPAPDDIDTSKYEGNQPTGADASSAGVGGD
ncbi:dimethylsulfoxide reductase [Haloferax mediterranei ATCC 33500]|uniref:Dimethyl sulfoxide reductase n=1 Tax=Haloferax mediterranei (strain ATCC 33500 / DSM 1411 / JCM 8866 / NBRC 14739 / NCIMB 2177 / R-4) TaxID=523841 RepID=I3R6N6_HALMT|nr:molybdopterin-dependent oxidoreductase [Haloferax mediterranei]AFK19896.1 dimethylsulfoxide reductase [Haloferax mediterranei ATCC 33500]AHZ23275.1 dimethyl sulfoxide reductase [Haloferax mediterranei ATCC 33500]ELZ99440.1 dimethylsulfoxide reductase [Haloferax mediterranei ATCC 33500]MDX5987355.1 molybdopterin-dependent oxidoreductase [Haloferax mediterranei ATCC 33500]